MRLAALRRLCRPMGVRHDGLTRAARIGHHLQRGSAGGQRRRWQPRRPAAGHQIGEKLISPGGPGALFGLAVDFGRLYFVDDSENQLNVLS